MARAFSFRRQPMEIVRIPEAKEFSAKERSPMPRRAHTVGIIGLGFGRAHIPAFQANGCQVVAVCQRNAAQAKAVADKYGVPRGFERGGGGGGDGRSRVARRARGDDVLQLALSRGHAAAARDGGGGLPRYAVPRGPALRSEE